MHDMAAGTDLQRRPALGGCNGGAVVHQSRQSSGIAVGVVVRKIYRVCATVCRRHHSGMADGGFLGCTPTPTSPW